MATKVKTHYQCDRCISTVYEDGAHGGIPPVGWSEFTLSERHEGSGWTNSRRETALLCHDCASEVLRFTLIKPDQPQQTGER